MALLQTAPGLAEQVYQAVVDDICDGVLAPGTHLVQEQLAAHYGVSRQPVQQAMALLKADGRVAEVGRRGLQVAGLDLVLMRHHYDIRAALDGLASRLAAIRCLADPALAHELGRRGRDLLKQGAAAQDLAIRGEGAHGDQIRADEAFHRLLYDASGNPLLWQTAEPHWRYLRRVMSDVYRHAEPRRDIWRQHADILEAVVAGDEIAAERAARDHIERAADGLAGAFAERQDLLTRARNGDERVRPS